MGKWYDAYMSGELKLLDEAPLSSGYVYTTVCSACEKRVSYHSEKKQEWLPSYTYGCICGRRGNQFIEVEAPEFLLDILDGTGQ